MSRDLNDDSETASESSDVDGSETVADLAAPLWTQDSDDGWSLSDLSDEGDDLSSVQLDNDTAARLASARDNINAAFAARGLQSFDDTHDGNQAESSDARADLPERLEDAAERSRVNELGVPELEDFAHRTLDIKRVALTDFDVETAREVVSALEVLKQRYPNAGGLEALGSLSKRNEALRAEQPELVAQEPEIVEAPNPGVVAQTLRDAGDLSGIAVNDVWAAGHATTTARLRIESALGASAPGVDSMRGVVTHEFGHVVDNELRLQGAYGRVVGGVISDVRGKGGDWISKNVSKYATTNDKELFAELFAEYHNSAQPRPEARRLGHAIDLYYDR